jgi:hypothetical protein
MPTSPNFKMSDWSLVRTIGQTISPFSGKQRTQEFDNCYWTATVSLPPMRRETAVEWQSFLLNLKGPINMFQFADPDALVNRGTFNGTFLKGEQRINNDSVTLSFSGSTITAGASTFGAARAGDFFHVSGAVKPENNGTQSSQQAHLQPNLTPQVVKLSKMLRVQKHCPYEPPQTPLRAQFFKEII